MRRVVVLAVLAMALPIAAWADGIDITNKGGSIAASISGIVSTKSHLTSFNGITAPPGHALGYLNFSTGAFSGTSLFSSGTFSSTGSKFVMVGQGNYGEPKGTIFSGSFIGPIDWTVMSHVQGKPWTFELKGQIEGMLWNGRTVTGNTQQTIYSSTSQFSQGIGHIRVGTTSTVPEPGTLGLLGTGLVGIAGIFRRKLMKS